MAEVKVVAMVNLRVTDREWRLIMKSLAYFAGVKVKAKNAAEEKEAEALNKSLLQQRVGDLKEQLKVAEGALSMTESEDPDGSAAVVKMAYEAGKQVERAREAREAQ